MAMAGLAVYDVRSVARVTLVKRRKAVVMCAGVRCADFERTIPTEHRENPDDLHVDDGKQTIDRKSERDLNAMQAHRRGFRGQQIRRIEIKWSRSTGGATRARQS
jgi:hypothetical protein